MKQVQQKNVSKNDSKTEKKENEISQVKRMKIEIYLN